MLGDAGRWACRVDPDRLVRGAPALLAAIGAERAVEDEGGGLLVAAPGVILRLGPLGAAEPGQGGFVYLADLVRTQ